jgi:NTE family protein
MSLWRRRSNKKIDLVLSSSGVRAPCFIGAIAALQDKGYTIERIAGSSGGAIIAAGFALGMTCEEMEKLSASIPYDSFRDFNLKNLLSLRNPSIYTGQKLDYYYKEIFGDKTLSDFKIDCKISVVTIVGRKRIILDKHNYPDFPIWKAVRMSSTIPFIFPYLELDGIPVTDGGLVTSMFDIFPNSPRQIVGLRPRADNDSIRQIVHNVKEHKLFIWNYIKVIAEFMLDAADNQHVPEIEWAKTVIIPTCEIGGFNFDLTQEDVQKLIKFGYDAVLASDFK